MKIAAQGLDCEIRLGPPADDWMEAAVRIRAPGFEGAFECWIWRNDWLQLIKVLRRLQSSIGQDAVEKWATLEGNIKLEFRLTRRGALTCAFSFCRNLMEGPTLSGTFEADQTFLGGWIEQAEEDLPR